MSGTNSGITCDMELRLLIETAFLDTKDASICDVEQPISKITAVIGVITCVKCTHQTNDQEDFLRHLIECQEGPQALTRFNKYQLYSKRIQNLQAEAQSIQQKNLYIPIKELPFLVLRLPYHSSLSRLFAAGAVLRSTEGSTLSSLFVIKDKSMKHLPLYIDFSSLYRNSFLLKQL